MEVTGPQVVSKSLSRTWSFVCLAGGLLSLALGTWMLPWIFSWPKLLRWLKVSPEFCLPGIILGVVSISVLWSVLERISPAHRVDIRTFLAGAGFLLTLSPVLSGVFTVGPQVLFVLGLLLIICAHSSKITGIAEILTNRLQAVSRYSRRTPAVAVAFILAILFLLEANLASYFLFGHAPHVQDSICQLFHSSIFLRGSLTAPAPAPPQAFEYVYMIIANGKWYSLYPPGHIALLALGQLINAPWIINPLFGALSVLLIFFLGREMFGSAVGLLSAALAIVCPFLIIMSAEFMNHVPTMFFIAAFMLCSVLSVKKKSWPWALLAGAGLGYAFLIRPMTAIAVALPWAIYSITQLAGNRDYRRDYAGSAVSGVVSFLAVASLFGLYNLFTNGDVFTTGYLVYDPDDMPRFGHSHEGNYHSPWSGLVFSLRNLNGVNFFLFGWPIPSLTFAAVAAAKGKTKWDLLLILSFLSLLAFYSLHWYQDWCLGPRYLFECIPAMLVLTARGIFLFPDLVGDFSSKPDAARVHACTVLLLSICVAVSLAVYWPRACRYFGNSFWRVDAAWPGRVAATGIKNAVVFVAPDTYAALLPTMSPWLDSSIIYARDRGLDHNREVMTQFPGRGFYIQSGNSIVAHP